MESVGQYLKNIREESDISLDKLSKELNISIYYIEAIENNNFSKTPGGVYTIGYIRSISDFFGLNTNEIIKDFKKQISFQENNNQIEITRPIQSKNIFYSYKFVSVFSIFAIGITFYYAFVSNSNISPNYALVPDVPENLLSEIEEIELETALIKIEEEKKIKKNNIEYEKIILETNTDLTASHKSSNSAIAAQSESEDIIDILNTITIQSLDPTWIQIRDDKKNVIFNKLLQKNEEYSYNLKKKYSITTGNAGNLIIIINGEVKGKLGKKGEVVESLMISPTLFQ